MSERFGRDRKRGNRIPADGELSKPVSREPVLLPPIDPDEVPDWTTKTIELLGKLTVQQREFVEHVASGKGAAESYRIAYNDYDNAHVRQEAYRLRWQPDVDAAVKACLGDRNFSARYDREFMLRKLGEILKRCENSPWPADKATAARVVKIMAEMQGVIVQHVRTEDTLMVELSPAMKRFMAAVEEAKQKSQVRVIVADPSPIER